MIVDIRIFCKAYYKSGDIFPLPKENTMNDQCDNTPNQWTKEKTSLSFSRSKKIQKTRKELYMKYLKRGLKIFSWGLIITLITWTFLKEGFVVFGTLHFIGISIILAYPFLKFRFLNLLIGIIVILLGIYLNNFTFNFPWLIWLGLSPEYFYTIDYFPIFPWFGVILIGLFFGNSFYPDYTRKLQLRDISSFSLLKSFCFLGRYSLLIYLIQYLK